MKLLNTTFSWLSGIKLPENNLVLTFKLQIALHFLKCPL